MSHYLQYFAAITHNTEQYCSFGSALSPKESHVTLGGNYPDFGNHCFRQNAGQTATYVTAQLFLPAFLLAQSVSSAGDIFVRTT